jgi:hypothetical protein
MKHRNNSIAALGSSERPMKSYGEGRTCAACDTKLSRYNESGRCGIHAGWGRTSGKPNTPQR